MARFSKSNIFRFLYQFHIYTGLLVSGFFMVIGITAISFNHPDLSKKDISKEITYSQPFTTGETNIDSVINCAVEHLGIWGHVPWWLKWEDKQKNVHFTVLRPGIDYEIVYRDKEVLEIKKIRKSVIKTLEEMHHYTPGTKLKSTPLKAWGFFSHIVVITGILTIALTLYFWKKKTFRNKSDWIVAGSVMGIAVLFILFIWLIG